MPRNTNLRQRRRAFVSNISSPIAPGTGRSQSPLPSPRLARPSFTSPFELIAFESDISSPSFSCSCSVQLHLHPTPKQSKAKAHRLFLPDESDVRSIRSSPRSPPRAAAAAPAAAGGDDASRQAAAGRRRTCSRQRASGLSGTFPFLLTNLSHPLSSLLFLRGGRRRRRVLRRCLSGRETGRRAGALQKKEESPINDRIGIDWVSNAVPSHLFFFSIHFSSHTRPCSLSEPCRT
jgi:hypothetical protein